ncbi:MAG: outer membrane lipoprotein carrier protein LolA [Desulfomonilaceae bacterium]|nr:outer membrane lipoprotein carrier protein LolA [Desulfomonilaceae bacterium]
MKRAAAVILLLLLVSEQVPVFAESKIPSVEQAVHRIQTVYAGYCCFKAAFDQLTVNVSMDLKDRFKGTMYVRKPGHIALDVDWPERQKVVIKGRSYTVFFPDEGNAARGEIPPEVNVEHFFGFFANIGDLDRNFTIEFPAKAFDESANLIFLELTDKKKPTSTFRILLGADRDHYTIRRAIIYDALGNYNRFDLSDITFLNSIPESQFQVAPGPAEIITPSTPRNPKQSDAD